MYRLYANARPFYRGDLSILRFWYPWEWGGVLEPIPHECRGTSVIVFTYKCSHLKIIVLNNRGQDVKCSSP